MYIFGDSTAFPLRENFLDTLLSTVRTCSALFSLECDLTKSLSEVQRVQAAAAVELAGLENLQNELIKSLKGAQGAASTQAAQLMSQAASKVLQQTRNQVNSLRDQAIAKATPGNVTTRVRGILSAFWVKNQLPHTRWSFFWRIGQDGEARADLRAIAKAVSVDFRTQIGSDQIWSAPILVSSLVPNIHVNIPIWTRRCKGTQTESESLSDYDIIEVDSSQSRQRFVLRRNGKAKHAIMITLADAAQSAPTIALIDEQQDVMGDTHRLAPGEIAMLSKLWNLLLEQHGSLIESRSEVAKMTMGNRSIETISHPSEIAEELLQIVAPLAREIRLRSRVPGELILKRATTKGRREEIFMSRDDLQDEYKMLPDRFRRVFDAMGLGNESTCDFVTMLGTEHYAKTQGKDRPRSPRVIAAAADAVEAKLDSVLLSIEAA
jgi:hypothetical protein